MACWSRWWMRSSTIVTFPKSSTKLSTIWCQCNKNNVSTCTYRSVLSIVVGGSGDTRIFVTSPGPLMLTVDVVFWGETNNVVFMSVACQKRIWKWVTLRWTECIGTRTNLTLVEFRLGPVRFNHINISSFLNTYIYSHALHTVYKGTASEAYWTTFVALLVFLFEKRRKMRILILGISLFECFHVQTFLRNKYLMDQKPFFLKVSN